MNSYIGQAVPLPRGLRERLRMIWHLVLGRPTFFFTFEILSGVAPQPEEDDWKRQTEREDKAAGREYGRGEAKSHLRKSSEGHCAGDTGHALAGVSKETEG